mgnify:CR=1 FL=1
MRYIEADKLLESVTKDDFNDWLDYDIFQHLVEETPTADVVPKSEVERLEHILNSYALQYGTVKDQQAVIDKAKAEVAREILDWIERSMVIYNPEIPALRSISMNVFNTLKKKYTEESNEV